jgi:predicted transglutaminase-like cysteine proteinase
VRILFLNAAICCGPAQATAQPNISIAALQASARATIGAKAVTIALRDDVGSNSRSQSHFLEPDRKDQAREDTTTTPPNPFGHRSTGVTSNEIKAKWAELQSRIHSEEQTLAACRSSEGICPAAARRFLDIVELGQQHQGRARLGQINRAVNLSIKPVSDWDQYGVADFWSSPLATLGSGGGDCEDYAIIKYLALRQSGITPDDLRLVIVRDIKHRTDHAVVAVRHEDEWLLLDNQTLIMANAQDVRHYRPLMVLGSAVN